MNACTPNIQIIKGTDGDPVFVVVPYDEFLAMNGKVNSLTPHGVVRAVLTGASPARAWREYLGLSQEAVAGRMGISQPGYAQHEAKELIKLTKPTREKIARALGITLEQLDF